MLQEKLISWLFETDALRVCPEGKPFWYTSGAIGPYYINTHFLYGSENKANELLNRIDSLKNDKLSCPEKLLEITLENYKNDRIYKSLIDEVCSYTKEQIGLESFSFISGGERRDWFFSIPAAHFLRVPHLTIFKDLDSVYTLNGTTTGSFDIKGGKALHIADLLNEAASYERAWIPAVKALGAEIGQSLVVVDRNQGGKQFLERSGLKAHSLIAVDGNLFEKALEMGLISEEQHSMLLDYIKDPRKSMQNFLINNPDFLQEALKAGGKTAERAKMCIEKKIYHIKEK